MESFTALDIGAYGVKTVRVEKNCREMKLTNIGYSSLREGAVVEGRVVEGEVVREAIHSSLKKAGTSGRRLLIGLPSAAVYSTRVSIPRMSAEELNQAIKWEAESRLPLALDEAIIDFVVLEEDESSFQLLLIAARRELVESYLEPFERNHLKPLNLNIYPFALYALAKHNLDLRGRNVVLLDIGAENTELIVIKEKKLNLFRCFPFGGDNFTAALGDALSLSFDRAEALKKRAGRDLELGGLSNKRIGRINSAVAKELRSELAGTINYFKVEERGRGIDSVYLTGCGSLTSGLKEELARELSLRVEWLDPLQNFSLEEGMATDLMELVPSLAVAIGLTLCELVVDNNGK